MEDWCELCCFCTYSFLMELSFTLCKTESGRQAESPPDLWFPHHTLFFFVTCIFMYANPFPIDKSLCVFFFVTRIFMYAKPFPIDKSLCVFYTIIPPLMNPLIYSLRNSELGVPIMVSGKQIRLGTMRLCVWSLALLSGLRIQHCHELCCRSQMCLRSHIAVALA